LYLHSQHVAVAGRGIVGRVVSIALELETHVVTSGDVVLVGERDLDDVEVSSRAGDGHVCGVYRVERVAGVEVECIAVGDGLDARLEVDLARRG